jgi:hypothetical protein
MCARSTQSDVPSTGDQPAQHLLYLADPVHALERGSEGIRVNSFSPGPIVGAEGTRKTGNFGRR